MHTPIKISNSKNCYTYPYHPSVVYVKNGWNGFKFWMAQSPLPQQFVEPYVDRYELPCIHASNDGVNWITIGKNPIDDLSQEQIENHNFFSDPHLVMRDGVLECFYRYTILANHKLENNKTVLLRKTSLDGVHWSDREVVADLRKEEDKAIWGEQIISQSLIWTGKEYLCWYVDASSYIKHRGVRMTSSSDGRIWQSYSQCEFVDKGLTPWHIDVQFYDGKYNMLVYDDKRQCVALYVSEDGLKFHKSIDVIRPSDRFVDFYSEGVYRSCSVKVDNEIFIYFSAHNGVRSAIGLLKLSDNGEMHFANGISEIEYVRKYVIVGNVRTAVNRLRRYVKHRLFDKPQLPILSEIDKYRNLGAQIGENVSLISPVNFGSEPYLITIGNNTSISFDVAFVTHDGATRLIRHLNDGHPETVIYGKIIIGDNCVIGCRTTILPNVKIGNNTIIGAGSIVNRDIPDNVIAAGNPCKVICTLDEYRQKHKDDFLYMVSLPYDEKKKYLLENL